MENMRMVKQWRTFGFWDTEDTLLSHYVPANLTSSHDARFLAVYPHTGVAIRVYGKDTASSDTCTLCITGWMGTRQNYEQYDAGPGRTLWKGSLTLGAGEASGGPIQD